MAGVQGKELRMIAVARSQGWMSIGVAGLLIAAFAAAIPVDLDGDAPVAGGPWRVGAGRKFQFAIVGDRTGGGLENWPIFEQTVAELNLLRPDFAIMAGDQIQGYTTEPAQLNLEWTEFLGYASRLEVPLLLLPGNHDISNPEMYAYWRERLGRTYHAFSYGECLFLLLNTHEHFEGGASSLGGAQVQWAVETLRHAAEARHIFVFLHVPLWYAPNPEWEAIEAALKGRSYTVVAGHLHKLSHETRHDQTYLVHGPTGGGVQQQDLLEMGRFHHYAMVTVDEDDAVHIAVVQPGAVLPADIATRAFQESVLQLVALETLMPEGLAAATVTTGVSVMMENLLPEPATVFLEPRIQESCAWRPAVPPEATPYLLQPGERRTEVLRFTMPADRVVPVPRFFCRAMYRDLPVFEFEQNMHLFPESALRSAPVWRAVGPFDAGPLPRQLPVNPRLVMPGAFVEYGPETTLHPEAVFSDKTRELRWQAVPVEDGVAPGFVNLLALEPVPFNALAYAACAVYSPEAATVYARFRVDDFGQVLVNGVGVENLRVFRTRSDPDWMALSLVEGWNTLVVKTSAISGGWSFRLLLADPEKRLQFAPGPPEE